MTTLPEANAQFALDVLRLMSEEHPTENLLFCPLSLTGSLGLLLFGSGSHTAAELEKVLHWDELKKSERVRDKRYLITRIKTSASPAKFQEKDKIYSSPRLHPEPQAKSHDNRRYPLEPQHARPSNRGRPTSEPEHTKPHDDRRQGRPEPEHTKPHDDRQQGRPEPEHTKPHDDRRQGHPEPEHIKPHDDRRQGRPEPEHTKPHDDRRQGRPEPEHIKPHDDRRQGRPEPEHSKPHDDRRQGRPEPEHTKPHDDRRQGRPEPEHTKPHDDKQGHSCPFVHSEPEAPSCPQRDVPDYECENPAGVHTAFSKILTELNKPSTNYFLSFANKLYGDYTIPFIQKFIFCALKLYLTEVGRADFHNAPEDMRRLINLWVEVQSHGEIEDLLPEHSLDSLTQLLMVNAVYFKGLWEIQFEKELTEEVPFYTNEKTSHTVQLMHARNTYNTGMILLGNIEVQILEIPYKNHEMSMFILLPKDESPESLLQLEDALTHAELLDWSRYLKPEDMEVAIPKFSMEKTTDVDKYLNLSQINDAEKADFSRAAAIHGVALSQLVHDTLFEVDEEGGEESATKEAHPRRRPCGAVPFVADHPFLFYVLHKYTQSIIIFGRFLKPE